MSIQFKQGQGFDSKHATINAAFGLSLIERGGAIYKHELFPEGKIKGKDNVIQFLMDNEEVYAQIEQQVKDFNLSDLDPLKTIDLEIEEHE